MNTSNFVIKIKRKVMDQGTKTLFMDTVGLEAKKVVACPLCRVQGNRLRTMQELSWLMKLIYLHLRKISRQWFSFWGYM